MPPEPEESSVLFRLPQLVQVFDELSHTPHQDRTVSRPDAEEFTPMLLSYTVKGKLQADICTHPFLPVRLFDTGHMLLAVLLYA
jgi:hypothetical protein